MYRYKARAYEIKKDMNKIELDYLFGFITYEEAKAELDKLNKEIDILMALVEALEIKIKS